ncbi:DUF6930 domain-containing protein [Paenibacillus sp. GCM10027626]|uniref:DUF7309 domain-containing protein n=1 Tax=Paenibacillus sp. GCM10027626 TaxID=3273411 RepID=UPI003628727A
MGQTDAAREEWCRLFETAVKFKKLACWSWMSNDDYFVVTDPETGEIGYCVVLGGGGIDYGLNVYLGANAGLFLQAINDSFDGVFADDNDELLFSTKAISLNFEDRGALDKKDLSLIRELGYKFRGSGEWPLFRSYEPGLSPWGLNGQQVRFLTVALEQAIHVGERFRENPDMYFEHDEADDGVGEKRLHRVPKVNENGIVWRDEWLPWHMSGSLPEPYTYTDEIRLQKLKNLKKSKEVWETDFQYAPVLFGERGERALYPRLCLWVEQETGMIMTAELMDSADCRKQYVEQLLDLLGQAEYRPARILTGSNKAFLALKNSAKKLGIPLLFNPHLDALLEAKEAIIESL